MDLARIGLRVRDALRSCTPSAICSRRAIRAEWLRLEKHEQALAAGESVGVFTPEQLAISSMSESDRRIYYERIGQINSQLLSLRPVRRVA